MNSIIPDNEIMIEADRIRCDPARLIAAIAADPDPTFRRWVSDRLLDDPALEADIDLACKLAARLAIYQRSQEGSE